MLHERRVEAMESPPRLAHAHAEVELGMVDLAESGLQVAKDRIGKAVEHVGFRHPARPAVMLHQW